MELTIGYGKVAGVASSGGGRWLIVASGQPDQRRLEDLQPEAVRIHQRGLLCHHFNKCLN